MTSTNGPLVHFAGSRIRFAATHPAILDPIDTHFRHCLGAEGELIAEYQIVSGAPAAFTVSRDGGDLLSDGDSERVLGFLMQDGLTQLNGASHTHLIFHAAALALGSQGVVLFGKSGSGKSTLAAGLILRGFDYLTDEVIAIPASGEATVSGFCRSLVLKRGSDFIWDRWRDQAEVDGLLRFKDGTAWVTPTLLNPVAPRSEVPPSLLLFVRYAAEAALEVERLTSANALFQMLQTLVNARNFADRGMNSASQLARQVPAFAVTYSDVEGVGEWIRTQIRNS